MSIQNVIYQTLKGQGFQSLDFAFSYVRSVLSKDNILARVYKMKNKLMVFFKAFGKQDLFLTIKLKEFYLKLANLVNIFEAINNLKSKTKT